MCIYCHSALGFSSFSALHMISAGFQCFRVWFPESFAHNFLFPQSYRVSLFCRSMHVAMLRSFHLSAVSFISTRILLPGFLVILHFFF